SRPLSASARRLRPSSATTSACAACSCPRSCTDSEVTGCACSLCHKPRRGHLPRLLSFSSPVGRDENRPSGQRPRAAQTRGALFDQGKNMSLKQQISDDMKAAMRAKEAERLATIRLLLAAIKQKEV